MRQTKGGRQERERVFIEDREKLWAGRDLGMAAGPLVIAHTWRTWAPGGGSGHSISSC